MRRFLVPITLAAAACSAPPPRPQTAPVPVRQPFAAPVTTSSAPLAVAPAEPEREPPPYDLAADLRERRDTIRGQVGDNTKFEVVDGVFLIAGTAGTRFAATTAKQALTAYFNGRFSRRPERAIAVLIFNNAKDYDAYCEAQWNRPCSTPFGFYDNHTVVMNAAPGIGTLTHELVHPIIEADFPRAPDWINEGIASLYEAFRMPGPGEIRGTKNFRLPRLVEALKSNSERALASLPALFATTNEEFRGEREGLNYSIARYFCQWMDSQNKLWPFYQAFRDGFADDPTGEKAFLAVMGKTPEELDASWTTWVKAL